MGRLLSMSMKMSQVNAVTIPVNWSFGTSVCSGDQFIITKNGVTVVGPVTSASGGSFTCVVGDLLSVSTTSGSIGTLCADATSEIYRNGDFVTSNFQPGFSATAIASWTVTAGTTLVALNGAVGIIE